MERKIAIMAIITGIAIFGGVASNVSSFMSNSSEELSSQTARAFLSGHVDIVIYDPDGNIKRYITGDNLITNNGENCIGEIMFGADQNTAASECRDTDGAGQIGNSPYDIIAIGSGGSALAQTAVQLETFELSQKVTPTFTESTGVDAGSDATLVWIATFTATDSVTYKESGIFDTTSFTAGNMLAHKGFTTDATLTVGDTIAVTWTVDVGVDTP